MWWEDEVKDEDAKSRKRSRMSWWEWQWGWEGEDKDEDARARTGMRMRVLSIMLLILLPGQHKQESNDFSASQGTVQGMQHKSQYKPSSFLVVLTVLGMRWCVVRKFVCIYIPHLPKVCMILQNSRLWFVGSNQHTLGHLRFQSHL